MIIQLDKATKDILIKNNALKKFKRNVREELKNRKEYCKKKDFIKSATCLTGAFIWSDTTEGFYFWRDIHRQIKFEKSTTKAFKDDL